ncbi:MAG: hypothetical protein WBH86_00065 [Thermogutta sp.]|nr:hypothetical protein [Thermogutta sp.]HPU05697.1 hypothetical protein [Thermogutta sp.]HQF12378.1 hypothetical protein [Thermogutta sp.]
MSESQPQSPDSFFGPLLAKITCPHCWHRFATPDTLWISEHPDLIGDRLLGPYIPQRFLPNRFTPQGKAIDSRGMETSRLACPNCHLEIPRGAYHLRSLFLSVLGAPASGKSYFLTSMVWRLRRVLPEEFAVTFTDLDAIHNQRLQEYENALFLNEDEDHPVELPKTETTGDLYNTVLFEDSPIQYIKPFLFAVQPMGRHPRVKARSQISRMLVIYDNAGESFLPGGDSAQNPVTRHLALSAAWFFVFDPTQDLRFRKEVSQFSNDPQVRPDGPRGRSVTQRQEAVLHEAWSRVLQHRDSQSSTRAIPLIVVCAKADCWGPLIPGWPLPSPYRRSTQGVAGVDMDVLADVSNKVRELLNRLSPEIVTAAESLTSDVIYLPVSATGCSPETDENGQIVGFLPKKLNPIWVEVPLIYFMVRWLPTLVFRLRGVYGRRALQPDDIFQQ